MHPRIRLQLDTMQGAGVKRSMPPSTRRENSYAPSINTWDLGDMNTSSILISSTLFLHSSPNSIITDESLSSTFSDDNNSRPVHVTDDNNSEGTVSTLHSNTVNIRPFSSQEHHKGILPRQQLRSQDITDIADLDIVDPVHRFDQPLSLKYCEELALQDTVKDTMPHMTKDTTVVHPRGSKQSQSNNTAPATKASTRRKKKHSNRSTTGKTHSHSITRSESEDSTTVQSTPTVKVSNLNQPQLLNTTFYDSSDGSTLSSCSRDVLKSSPTREYSSSFTTRHTTPTVLNPILQPTFHSTTLESSNMQTSKQTPRRSWLLHRKTKKEMSTTTPQSPSRRTSLVAKLSHMLFPRSSSPVLDTSEQKQCAVHSSQEPAFLGSHHHHHQTTTTTYEYLDSVIQERWDGMDLLSLGVAYRPRLHDTCLDSSFYKNIGQVIVSHSLYPPSTFGDSMFPVLVMDGYQPTGEDRWSISIQRHLSSSSPAISIQKDIHTPSTINDATVGEDWNLVEQIKATSFHMPLHLLLSQMHTKTCTDREERNGSSSDPKHLFPPSSSCPMDIDEDIFLIQSLDNLKSIYNAVADHVENADLDPAVEVMEKLVRSLLVLHGAHNEGGNDIHHVIGTAYHNLGIVQMWAGRYDHAVLSFHAAVRIRTKCKMPNATCLCVSLSKLGIIHFALGHLQNALECFEGCLKLKLGLNYLSNGELQSIVSKRASLDPTSLEIGKLMNNMGVAYYQNGQFANALHCLTQSLEYYKNWIEGPMKRESLLHDASVVIGNVGRVYVEQGDYDMAQYMYEETLMLHSSYLKPNSMAVLTTLGNVAYGKAQCRDFSGALKIFQLIHKSYVERFGASSCLALEISALMGLVLIHQSEFSEAYEKMKDVLSWQLHQLDISHPAILITTNLLSQMRTLMETEV